MKILVLLTAALAVALVMAIVRSYSTGAARRHDPVEYYRGWGGYAHPIRLQTKINREEADAVAAGGGAFLIGHFDARGRLTRVVKRLRGATFFDFTYEYHDNGKLKAATIANADGVTTLRRYDERGRGAPDNPAGFW